MTRTFKLLAVGVGGQGVLSTVRLLGTGAAAAGLSVRVGQHHGMAQRGGSVEAALVIGPGESGFVSRGEADVVLALEPLEALRAVPRMGPETVVLLEPTRIVPYSLTSRGLTGPSLEEMVSGIARVARRVLVVDAAAAARRAGAPQSLNVAMLGALAALELLPIPAAELRSVLERLGHSALRDVNLRAFDLGLEQGRRAAAAAGAEGAARG